VASGLDAEGAKYAAMQHEGGSHASGGGHDSDSHSDHDSDSHSDHDSDHGSQGNRGGQSGRGPGEAGSGGHRGLDDILRDVVTGDDSDEDSDRPDWAGGGGGPNDRGGRPEGAGSTRGDLYGDMYVILRDENGVPILSPEGFVQPIDADGNPIPLDEEGAPIDPSLATEVELGRLNVGRSPSHVLIRRADEVITLLNEATDISLDAAGRLVLTVDGETRTIDSPLENLAIYVALMTTGTIPDVADLPGTEYDFLVDGVFTNEDLAAAVGFLAGATDKAGELLLDDVAYINAILDINTSTTQGVLYSDMDYSGFSYDRSDVYDGVTATVLVQQPDGSWVPQEVDIYDAVFGGDDFSDSGTMDAFAQAADDAREVVNFLHEYEVPVDQ
jgi:hypothetical protein